MTIEQAQDAAELLKHRNKIKAIQSRMKADKTRQEDKKMSFINPE